MTTKTEAASQVRTVLQSIKDRLAEPGGAKVNEATTRAHFLNPLLEALGYRSIDDIVYEHYLPDGKTFLDYRLVVDNKPRVSVEAKGLDVPLADKDAAQVVSYATILGDEWAVLTNAREWRLYHTFAPTPLSEKRILTANLVGWSTDAEFESLFDQLWLTSKEAFSTGDGPGAWLTSLKLDNLIRRALTDPSSPEVKYIRKRLEGQGVNASTDQIASWLKLRLDASPQPPSSAIEKPLYPTRGKAAGTVTKERASALDASSPAPVGSPTHWLIPSGKRGGFSAAEHLKLWLDKGFWGFGASTPGRKAIHVGDWACFYAAKSGLVLAYGQIAGELDTLVLTEEWPGPDAFENPTYKVPLENVVWVSEPVHLDAGTRASLDAFKGKEPTAGWSWLVQTTHRVSEADFLRLTGR